MKSIKNILLPDHEEYASLFLALVAIPSIVGEMSLAIWLLLKGAKKVKGPFVISNIGNDKDHQTKRPILSNGPFCLSQEPDLLLVLIVQYF